jgi:GT2 family glycosyltransferase/predicted SAM-dependent methyltransferase
MIPNRQPAAFDPSGSNDFVEFLARLGLCAPGGPLRLHLGCGERHLDGYINLDYPPSEHTVQTVRAADVYADLLRLNLPPLSVDEIRLQHVFEHFDRPTALALLCRWHVWLKPGGVLLIETPDLQGGVSLLNSPFVSYRDRQVVIRHLFGSHEANWAVHWDGWDRAKYDHILTRLGYENLHFQKSNWKMTRNITVRAEKRARFAPAALQRAAAEILRESMVDETPGEERLWQVWRARLDDLLGGPPPQRPAGPRVSIFVPVYNGAKYLPAALDSLLTQTFTDFEVLIADDGSIDDTLRLARAYAERDPRIRVLQLPHGGEVQARNAAIAAAAPSAAYLLNHDSDDLSLPDKLAKLVNYLDAHPDAAIVGCRTGYFGDNGKDLGSPPIEITAGRIRATFGDHNSIIHSAALTRREVYQQLGGYRQEYRSADDYDFYARALLAGWRLVNLPEVLHHTRLHPGSVSRARSQAQAEIAGRVRAEYIDGLKRTQAQPMPPASKKNAIVDLLASAGRLGRRLMRG